MTRLARRSPNSIYTQFSKNPTPQMGAIEDNTAAIRRKKLNDWYLYLPHIFLVDWTCDIFLKLDTCILYYPGIQGPIVFHLVTIEPPVWAQSRLGVIRKLLLCWHLIQSPSHWSCQQQLLRRQRRNMQIELDPMYVNDIISHPLKLLFCFNQVFPSH